MCDCDPILLTIIYQCYIDYSTIRRPAISWVTALTQTNNSKYLISSCPMDYCLPYSSSVNLFYPNLQCQFIRTKILCSQCQHHLSMVFGSSRCMKCTNVRTYSHHYHSLSGWNCFGNVTLCSQPHSN